jgi:hypothetical protein
MNLRSLAVAAALPAVLVAAGDANANTCVKGNTSGVSVSPCPTPGEVRERRLSTISCIPQVGFINSDDCSYPGNVVEYTYGNIEHGYSYSCGVTSGFMVNCPIPNDSHLPHDNVTTLQVYEYEDSNYATLNARACVKLGGSGGGYCGSAWLPQQVGQSVVNINDLSSWTGPARGWDTPYLLVFLPQNASLSEVYLGRTY